MDFVMHESGLARCWAVLVDDTVFGVVGRLLRNNIKHVLPPGVDSVSQIRIDDIV